MEMNRKARRKMNRKLRLQGLEVLVGTAAARIPSKQAPTSLNALEGKAERDIGLRCRLNSEIDTKGPGAVQAKKLKRKLNDSWTNRGSASFAGYWNPNGTANPAR